MSDSLNVKDLLALIPLTGESVVINGLEITNKGTFVFDETHDDE